MSRIAMTAVIPVAETGDMSGVPGSGVQYVSITADGHCFEIPVDLDFYDDIEALLFDLELEARYQISETDGKSVDTGEFLENLKAGLLHGQSI